MYDNVCQCAASCLRVDSISSTFKLSPDTDVCSLIKVRHASRLLSDEDLSKDIQNYDTFIGNALAFFENQNRLVKVDKSYYINTGSQFRIKFTWDNVKGLDNQRKLQQTFWLFRKLVVDSLLKKIVMSHRLDEDVQLASVGSTKISSDYDITLFGSTAGKVKVIDAFNAEFYRLFGDKSSVVFDTNIYGMAFISFTEHEFDGAISQKHETCPGQPFRYLLPHPSPSSDLMWGLVKLLRDVRTAFGENTYNDYLAYLRATVENDGRSFYPLGRAHETFVYLKNRDVSYTKMLLQQDKKVRELMMQSFNDPSAELTAVSDFISALQFYGDETYFSRGAFLDTVVNSQLCNVPKSIPQEGQQPTSSAGLQLSTLDYINSVLENAGFFFVHSSKTKYALRVYRILYHNIINGPSTESEAFQLLKSTLAKSDAFRELTQTVTKLQTVTIEPQGYDYDKKYCKSFDISSGTFNLLACEKYKLFQCILGIISMLLVACKRHLIQHDGREVYNFYDVFVSKNEQTRFPTLSRAAAASLSDLTQ